MENQSIPQGYALRDAGPAPFGPDTKAMVLFRDGTTCSNSNRLCAANWEHRPTKGWGHDCDIIAVKLPNEEVSETLHGREKPKGNITMRIFALIAAAVAAITFAAPAQAQSLGDILGVIDSTRYNNCNYSSGTYRATCQANRVSRVIDTIDRSNRNSRYEASERLDRQIRMINALQRACDAGDAHSCQRLGGRTDPNRITAARALMDACRNGDSFSCDRAQAVLTGNDRSYGAQMVRQSSERGARGVSPRAQQQATRLSPTQARIGNCIVDIDPETGMRTSGPYGCSR
tara:strand:- start:236 stop:1099 length:864 start_codon:yes stop_codon:yes gene_type:complete